MAGRMLALKEMNEGAHGQQSLPPGVQENEYVFVVFQGGTTSVATVKVDKDCTWTTFLGKLSAKLPSATIYAIAYVDPSESDAKAKVVKTEADWQLCLSTCLREKDHELEIDLLEQPPAKPYKLSLKLGKTEKKKITYLNPYEREVTFNVASTCEWMEIKEKRLTIPPGERGAIVFKFPVVEEEKQETIIVTLAEDHSKITHTIKIIATWA